ncbi:proline-, glutamic acid- and leucine-rich protein 1 [Drosophila serrata]|uniref:proline-, glutamic acid- and leucine-rich protein 1 n=1 Tax=Drosophila serrata TaxID=7274 RepID=UPI000A1D0201|nr:proline-, glutamic acid- and leucine-rich protein 1 [Drosophila serrata]
MMNMNLLTHSQPHPHPHPHPPSHPHPHLQHPHLGQQQPPPPPPPLPVALQGHLHSSNHYMECRALPAINETFPQFGQHRPTIALLSPLDLSLRAAASVVPITPPSTPSPPRKRQRLMSEENYLWRPHIAGPAAGAAVAAGPSASSVPPAAALALPPNSSYFLHQQQEPPHPQHHQTYSLRNFEGAVAFNKSHETKNSFEQIPTSQSSVSRRPSPIYVDDETIVLTEDEDETVVSSHDYNDYAATEDTEEINEGDDETLQVRVSGDNDEDDDEDEEEVFVDVLGSDDDEGDGDAENEMLVQPQLVETRALKRNELLYEDEELHHKAIDGLARLFDREFPEPEVEITQMSDVQSNGEKTYTDLSGSIATAEAHAPALVASLPASHPPPAPLPPPPPPPPAHPPRPQKAERKRSKLRKHMAIDEETISPVSGTIIRKLRDDEELVVRKGDIDPAFNVVEITEEAKAILASIDNKIGDYLCQLCRTVYDDAFMLAQHRCPRIVHIEYKCSECEKVFNCPANLASHRRWHKPKADGIGSAAGGNPGKKRLVETSDIIPDSVRGGDDNNDGIYPCHICGKSFRRQAYLKKHQASHQMLENLKNLDFFKAQQHQQHQQQLGLGSGHQLPDHVQLPQPTVPVASSSAAPYATNLTRPPTHGLPLYPPVAPGKNYAPGQRFPGFPFQPFDQRRFYSLGEFYLSQHLERSSAFQYVQANHLRQLSNVAQTLMPPLPVK